MAIWSTIKRPRPWEQMLITEPPLEQTGGTKEEGQDKETYILPMLQEKRQPRQQGKNNTGPTFELMKGTCKSLTELEYFCEEVYKATTEKLDWINPEGRQYPHGLQKPLPLVPNSQGLHVIPFHHFINNDLEYLRGGESSRKYSTSVTKTKAADYGHIKWIEDLVPNSMWTRDVYTKRRIIAVTKVELVEWQNYKHLDWITVRRDDDILYKFKKGDFHRLQCSQEVLSITKAYEVIQLGVETAIKEPKPHKAWNLMPIDEYKGWRWSLRWMFGTALNDRLKESRMAYCLRLFGANKKSECKSFDQAIDTKD
ncbi:hypothetical protein Tco_1538985 [Tanacetum coccineum]